jgi:hypothetical protein
MKMALLRKLTVAELFNIFPVFFFGIENFHCVQSGPLLYPVLSQIKPTHILFINRSILIFSSYLPFAFSVESLYAFSLVIYGGE